MKNTVKAMESKVEYINKLKNTESYYELGFRNGRVYVEKIRRSNKSLCYTIFCGSRKEVSCFLEGMIEVLLLEG